MIYVHGAGGGTATPAAVNTMLFVRGSTNQSAVQALIDTGNISFEFSATEDYQYSNLLITGDNVTFNLNGATLNSLSDNQPLIRANGGANFRISNGKLASFTNALVTPSYIATADAIKWHTHQTIKASNLSINGFRGTGIRVGGANANSNASRLYHIDSCDFYGCYIGFINEQDAEYGMISNCRINACGIAGINNSGNWAWHNISANYCKSGIVHASVSSNFHAHTGNPVHGIMSGIQINHITTGSVFPVAVVITLNAIDYSSFGFLSVGVLPSPISGMTMYYAGIIVLGNTDITYPITNLLIQNGVIDGGSDKGINISNLTKRTGVTIQGNVTDTILTIDDKVAEALVTVESATFRIPNVTLFGYNVDLNTPPIGNSAVGTAVTDYTDFITTVDNNSKFTVENEPTTATVALYMDDDDGKNPQVLAALSNENGANLETFGGYITIEFIKDTARNFGGIWIDLPSGNFNTYIFVTDTTIDINGSIITSNNTAQFNTLKLIFNGNGTFSIEINDILEFNSLTFSIYSTALHNNALFSNRTSYLSGSSGGTGIGGYIKKYQTVIYNETVNIIINAAEKGKSYILQIPVNDSRIGFTLQIPNFKYPQGVQLTIDNKSNDDASFIRESNIPLINGLNQDLTVPAQTKTTLTSAGKGFSWVE